MGKIKSKFLLRLPAELKETLTNIAERQGLTLTGLITQVLWDFVNKSTRL